MGDVGSAATLIASVGDTGRFWVLGFAPELIVTTET